MKDINNEAIEMTQEEVSNRLSKIKTPDGMGPITLTAVQAWHIRNSPQYAIETFAETCGCGKCDPCTAGTRDLEIAVWLLPTRQA